MFRVICFILIFFSAGCSHNHKKLIKRLAKKEHRKYLYISNRIDQFRRCIEASSDTVISINDIWLYKVNQQYCVSSLDIKYRETIDSKMIRRIGLKTEILSQSFDTLTSFIRYSRVDTITSSPQVKWHCDDCTWLSFVMTVKKDTIVCFSLSPTQTNVGDTTHPKWQLIRLSAGYLRASNHWSKDDFDYYFNLY